MSTSTSSGFRERRTDRFRKKAGKVRTWCTKKNIAHEIANFFPILKWLPSYDFKHSFFGDLSGGLTMAVFSVPQGIALAGITGVDPVYGLYTAIFPSFFYIILGTSKHNALGGFGVLSLMTHSAIEKVMQRSATPYNSTSFVNHTIPMDVNITEYMTTPLDYNDTAAFLNETFFDYSGGNDTSFVEEITTEEWTEGFTPTAPINVATTVLFVGGIIQILLGVFRLHYLTCYFSEQVMSGFVVGGYVHVFFAQIGDALGIKLPKRSGPGYLYHRIWDLYLNSDRIHMPTAIISFLSSIFLVFGKEFLGPRMSEVFLFPVPFEFVLVVVGITATNFAELATRHQIHVVTNIPRQFPTPTPPRFDLVPAIAVDSLSIAITAVAIHLTVAKVVEKRYKYKINYAQELYALGFVGVLSSFFPVFPVTSGFARSVVGAAVGSSTQLTCFFSSLALVSVIVYIGPALEYLPQCILATMIIISQKGIFEKFSELRQLWPLFKIDFAIWVVSMLLTICYDMAEGFCFAIAFAATTTVLRSQWPRWHILLQQTDGSFRETKKKELEFVNGKTCVFRMDAPLIFTSVDRFTVAVWQSVKTWERTSMQRFVTIEQMNEGEDVMDEKIANIEKRWKRAEGEDRCNVVIDCSGFPYVDYLGMTTLKTIYADLATAGIQSCFVVTHGYLLKMFDNTEFYAEVGRERVFGTVKEAVDFLETNIPDPSPEDPPPDFSTVEQVDEREIIDSD